MQQVGGVSEIPKRVPQALSLDPDATAPSSPPANHSSSAGPLYPRRRPASRQAAFGRRLGLALFMGLSGALFFSILTDGGKQTRAVVTFLPAADEILYWTGLRIDQVSLSGQRFTPDADVFEAIDIPNTGSLVTFDAGEARSRIEKLPWVSTVAISRIFPGSLDVRITERHPSALWVNDGREYLVDGSGRVLSALKKGTDVRLPRLSGESAPDEAQALLDLIVRFPLIAERFEMAERVGGRRWTLHMKGGVVVHLGADREAVAFAALSAPEELGKLVDTPNAIIDLRARGRVTVRIAPPTTPANATQS
ncbi:MAG: FtsQ-type POTRA domain-containing protein [Hyphomicrobium sp.]|nr:FtsQ-type POTRA domain-containing protein [Hyphomicrobium sp.]